jgi:uncharacterized protein (TIGR03437 family)
MIFLGYGTNMGPKDLAAAGLDAQGRIANINSGVRLLFDNAPAPIVYVSAGQVSGIVPYAVAGKQSTQVVAEYNGVQSAPLTVAVADAVPGLFSAHFSGTGQGAIFNQDNSANSSSNRAAKGSIIVLFGTGEGQTDPGGLDGRLASSSFPKPKLSPSVTIGGIGAEILYAGAAPGLTAGLFQINVRVPASASSGDQPVIASFGSFRSLPGLTVAIQ